VDHYPKHVDRVDGVTHVRFAPVGSDHVTAFLLNGPGHPVERATNEQHLDSHDTHPVSGAWSDTM
jgi:hypothetical protein